MNPALPTYAKIIDDAIIDGTSLTLNGSIERAVNGLLIKSPVTFDSLDLSHYEVPLIVRSHGFKCRKLTISHFAVDGWHQCADQFDVDELIITVPLDLLDDYKKHIDNIKHPDAVQFIPLDADGNPDDNGIISNGRIGKVSIKAKTNHQTKERGCQGIASFNGTLNKVSIGENGISIASDIDQHGISCVHAIDCVFGSETEPCTIFSPSRTHSPGIVISDRKQDRVSTGNQLVNIKAAFFDVPTGATACKTVGCDILNTHSHDDHSEDENPQMEQPMQFELSPEAARARGIRNDNPGNIETSSSYQWVGQAKPHEMTEKQLDEDRFCVFVSPNFGIRALAILLQNYQSRHKLTSIKKILNRYAPRQDNNNTNAYVAAVCSKIGVAPTDTVSMKNFSILKGTIIAIIEHENGVANPYPDELINESLAMSGVDMPHEPTRVDSNRKSTEMGRGGAVVGGTGGILGAEALKRQFENPQTTETEIVDTIVEGKLEKIEVIKPQAVEAAGAWYEQLTMFEIGQLVFLGIIAFAAVDWMLDRRLTKKLGLR